MTASEPSIDLVLDLKFVGDWGQANFHRICSWLCQEVCDRAGRGSRVSILSMRDGGRESMELVQAGEADMCIATPAMTLGDALPGRGMFNGIPLPQLRALAVLPQNDRLVLAIDAKYGIKTFAELREQRPPLTIAASVDDGTNFIGYVTRRYMDAHGIDEATLESWGGRYVTTVRPEQALALMVDGPADALVQEAIMTPWWRRVMENESRPANLLPAEEPALTFLEREYGYRRNSLPAGYWKGFTSETPTLDFSDFGLLVREDMPEDLAYLLTWCIVETRDALERGYRHLEPRSSPLSYPLDPVAMTKTPIPLHPGAKRYFRETGRI